LITKSTIERILDSYLNVLYEAQSKGKTIIDFKKTDLLEQTYRRANKQSKWFCKTPYQRAHRPMWVLKSG